MATAISLFEARALVLACACPPRAVERVPLAHALGRHLGVDVAADGPWPATDRAAMDGFAVVVGGAVLAAGAVVPVVGESLAGRPFAGELSPGRAVRIMTGAVVPAGADAVVPVEQTSGFSGAEVTLRGPVRAGQNIRRRGSEVGPGQPLLAAGRRIGPAEVGALAVLGYAEVPVRRKVRVAIVATGDEVVAVDARPAPHQVRESNSWALAAQVTACGGEALRLGIAPDEHGALRAMLARGLLEADVLATIGGVSKGSHDLVHDTLEQLGVATRFHGVQLKPGKPTYFGTRSAAPGAGDGAPGAGFVFGLPGNPAACFTVFDLLVRPLLHKMVGAPVGEWCAQLPPNGADWHAHPRWRAVPVRLAPDADGALCAELAPASSSGNPFGLLGQHAYGLLPAGQDRDHSPRITVVGASSGVELP